MKRRRLAVGVAAGVVAGGAGITAACSEATNPAGAARPLTATTTKGERFITLQNHSVTPALVKDVMPGVSVTTLLSSEDVLPGSPSFVFGGSADGMGLLRNVDGTFTLVVNNEDNFAVSRITLDSTFAPRKGEYILTADNAKMRLCSATLATEHEHGFGPTFFTAGETSVESVVYTLDPTGGANTAVARPALGHWSAENAVPLPKTAFGGKTVVLIGDDDSGPFGGQLAMYVSDQVGDLENGRLYVMARAGNDVRERDMVSGQQYAVEFRQIPDQKTLTGAQINAAAASLHAVVFGRVEDVDYRRKGAGREVFFNVTGQNNTGVNADYSRSKYGRVYKLTLDADDPTTGTLEVLLDGDDRSGPAGTFQNPDNIVATKDYLYVQEDPNGYGDETHDGRIYQYDLRTKALKVVLELDHRRGEAKYNAGGPSALGDWESSGIMDVSDLVGRDGTFLFTVQAHTWLDDRFKSVDGTTVRPNERQGSQVLVLSGLPR